MKQTLFILVALLSVLSTRGNSSIIIEKSGKGSPVIIIAGLGGTQAWQNTVQKLSLQNTCYLISIKGLSGDISPAQSSFPDVEHDILNFISDEKLTKPVLIGHSFGGFLVMEIASANPGIFSKIVIVDAYPFGLALYNPAFTADFGLQQSRVLQNQLNSLPDPSYEAFWSQNVEQFTIDTISQKAILQKILSSEKRLVIEAQMNTLSTDLRQKISSITCPVTVVCSSYLLRKAGLPDEQIEERINQQFNSLKVCNIFITNEAKHFIMIDSPGWFLEKILNKVTI